MHQAVVIDRLDVYPRPESLGPRSQESADLHDVRLGRVNEPCPVQPFVVFAIEINSKVDYHLNHLRLAIRGGDPRER
jgi:hypothetical protein